MQKPIIRREVGGGSHDCWIWRGLLDIDIGKHNMGVWYCDGVLACQLYDRKYILKNPTKEIETDLNIYHLHLSNVRSYNWYNRIIHHRVGVRFSNNDNVFNKDDMYSDGYG